MPPEPSPSPASASPGPSTTQSGMTVHDLEMALEQALAERNQEFAVVEEELQQLARIYKRMHGDMRQIKEERDRAVDAARVERELRARETLDLTARLEQAMRQKDTNQAVDAATLRERFVAERLASSPVERLKLPEDAMPAVPGFEVLGRIGSGGMATVYHARRVSDGMEVALKLLHDGAESGRVRTELFLREAAVMLQLDHPGLVSAFDAGDCSYGRYLAMEFVAGESLSTRVRREGPVTEEEAVKIAIGTARALSYCARLGLTHRDVKPSNLIQTTTGAVKLCDFGLAALSAGNDDDARPYGSPGYASPEQLATPADVDERADIYGLGCTLYHLVAGRRPYAGPAKEAFDQAKASDLPDPRLEGAEISTRLAQVIRHMGRADREKRYRRWDECLLDLMLVEKGNPPFAAHIADQQDPMLETAAIRAIAETIPTLDVTVPSDASTHSRSRRAAPAPLPAVPPRLEPILPPPAPPTPRSERLAAFLAGAMIFGALGVAVVWFARPDAIAAMRDKARALAAAGRHDEAASSLRAAALLAPPEVAARLAWEADAIEKK